ncbi:MAG: 1-deoxy-D-xylulose-5-phosphate synthase [Bacillota bacterium]|nr:1-deoxy-D-xylulose-5-phosphate synthase [Bacillota bacterium]
MIKKMSLRERMQLAEEVRAFLISNVSKTGGHLGSNLGVVELTIALHSVLGEQNEIVWDVGHQSYVHKILTGRASQFPTLRKLHGLSGFPKRKESRYDSFDTGHSTTSISAAVGISIGKRAKGDLSSTYVVIGDGALTGGMAFEALNHLGSSKENVKIILNDNQMSISPNVGGVVNALRSTSKYNKIKKRTRNALERIPLIGKSISSFISAMKRALRSLFIGNGQLFEELGVKYLGKVDGHCLKSLEKAIKRMNAYDGPALLHVYTVKGKGYALAEKEPEKYHGVGVFDPDRGVVDQPKTDFSAVFGSHLIEMAQEKEDIVAISAAMIDGTGLKEFSERVPDRIFDVGIAEQHAVTFAAGLAVKGIRPFVAIYSTFLQRAYDQIIHDVCLQNLPVVFCIDRAGVVGADGETHHGILDIAYLGSIPNLTILSVSDYRGLRCAMDYAYTLESPVAIRYPRGGEVAAVSHAEFFEEEIGNPSAFPSVFAEKISSSHPETQYCESLPSPEKNGEKRRAAIFTTGRAVKVAKEVQERLQKSSGIMIPVYNIVQIKPMVGGVKETIRGYDCIFTVEDHMVNGGFGDRVRNEMNDFAKIRKFGFEDFVPHGTQDELYEHYGLSVERICDDIVNLLSEWM